MRILAVSNFYPPYEVGGYEQLCRDVMERLRTRGHDVAVITSDHRFDSQKGECEQGIERVFRLQPQPPGGLNIAMQFFLMRRRAEAHNRRAFGEMVKRYSPDVVFIWNLQGLPMELAVDAERLPGIGVAYWLAGYAPAEPDLFWRYWAQRPGKRTMLGGIKGIMRRVAYMQMRHEGKPVQPQMQHVAVVSEFMRCKGLAEGTLPDHTQVIYNGVEVEQFFCPVHQRAVAPLRIIVAGRVSEDKGVHTAIEAVKLATETHGAGSFHLTIAGSGPPSHMRHIQSMVEQLGLSQSISMVGWISREQMPNLMADHHVLLLPTIHPEPFARVVLEAMVAGLAVVAAATGGTPEIVRPGETGLLFPAGDASQLAAQIGRLLSDDALRCSLASSGQALVVKEFDLDRMATRIERLLIEAQHSVRPLDMVNPLS